MGWYYELNSFLVESDVSYRSINFYYENVILIFHILLTSKLYERSRNCIITTFSFLISLPQAIKKQTNVAVPLHEK